MSNQELVQTCTYWQLPAEERQALIQQTPKQPTWVLDMRRLDDGYWCFDYPSLKTYRELMLGGTELLMDHYYQELSGELPTAGSYMVTTVSTEPLDETHVVLTKVSDDADGSGGATYQDCLTGEQGWLCGYVQLLWKEAPQTIFVNLQPQL